MPAKKKKQKSNTLKSKKTSSKKVVDDEEFFKEEVDESSEDINEEDIESEENTGEEFDDYSEGDEEDLNLEQPVLVQKSHIRSNGLFSNPWWKRGLLKGIIAWLIIVVFFYMVDFVGLIEVVDAKRWGFFLLLLIILGMAWEKFLYKFIKI